VDFSDACQKLGIVDKRKITLAKLDIIFCAANTNPVAPDVNSSKLMMRFEFFEALLRLAVLMYKDTKITQTYAEAFQMLISEVIKPNYDWVPWQEWRDLELWTLEVNDLFYANLEHIRRIYHSYFTVIKKFFSKEDAHRLFLRDTDLKITEKDFYLAYGTSKMTISKET